MQRKNGSEAAQPALPGEERPLLEEIVSTYGSDVPEARAPSAPLVGECVDDRHPTLAGRVRVRWVHAGEAYEKWLPTLAGVVARTGDRVLLTRPANWPDVLVSGVIDGFDEERERPRQPSAALALRPDETLEVVSEDGKPLLEVWSGEGGPVVRLLQQDVDVRIDGNLRLRARAIALEADEGRVELRAKDDVVLKGEVIHLN